MQSHENEVGGAWEPSDLLVVYKLSFILLEAKMYEK